MQDFFELVNKRQSCRKYSDRKIEKEKLMKCIEAARVAPSACNSQPWHFIVINNKDLVKDASKCIADKIMNKFVTEAPAIILAVEESGNLTSRAGELLKKQDFRATDVAIACEHICLMAEELGLGTCIMGWFNEKKLKKMFNVEKSKRIRLIMSIGYPYDEKIRRKVRKDLNSICTYIE